MEVDLFCGQVSANTAHLYARVERLPGGREWTLRGQVRGPYCRHAKTLPTNYSFVDLGAGETLLARATLPDPCFWSPELPALYQVSLELRQQAILVQTFEQEFGVRFFGVRGRSLYFTGQRWVVRGVHSLSSQELVLPEWRDASAALFVTDPSDELCREASREGVFIVAKVEDLDQSGLRRLAKWAAVGLVVHAGESEIPVDLKSRFPNITLARSPRLEDGELVSPAYAVLFVRESELLAAGQTLTQQSLPIVVARQIDQPQSLLEARAACDDLQRDLAATGDFAGYLIDFK